MDGRQPCVSCIGGAPPLSFNVVQESCDHLFRDILDGESIYRSADHVSRKAQQQLDGVTIGLHGIDRKTFLYGQIVTEEALYEVGQ